MSELNDDMWEQIELNNYGKGKLVHIVNEQAELIRSLYEQLDSAHREGWEQAKREVANTCHNHRSDYGIGGEYIVDSVGRAIANLEYKEKANE